MYTRHCAYEPPKALTTFPGKQINGFINNTLSTKIIAVAQAAKENLTDTGVSDKKITVIINGVGIGMPGLSYEREAISAYYDDKYEEGKQFAYIYPGMNRVLQAAGRVIRREDDRGVIVLIDDRFDDPIYKKIIPTLWRGMKFYKDPAKLRESLDKFWAQDNSRE